MGILRLIWAFFNSQIGESHRSLSYIQRKEPRPKEVKKLIHTTWQNTLPGTGSQVSALNYVVFWPQKSITCLEAGNGDSGVRSPHDNWAPWTGLYVNPQGMPSLPSKSPPVLHSAQPALRKFCGNFLEFSRTLECPGPPSHDIIRASE